MLCDILSGCQYFGNISGNVHLDTSANCQLDSLKQGPRMKNIKVNLNKNNSIVKQYFVNYYGDYVFTTDLNDTFVVSVDTSNNPFDVTCPKSKDYQAIITSGDNIHTNLNFGLNCKGNPDYGVGSISATRFRPSFLTDVLINAGELIKSFYGVNCWKKLGGIVKTEIIGPVSYVKPGFHALTPISVTNNGKLLLYNTSDFSSLLDSSFNIVTITKEPNNCC